MITKNIPFEKRKLLLLEVKKQLEIFDNPTIVRKFKKCSWVALSRDIILKIPIVTKINI